MNIQKRGGAYLTSEISNSDSSQSQIDNSHEENELNTLYPQNSNGSNAATEGYKSPSEQNSASVSGATAQNQTTGSGSGNERHTTAPGNFTPTSPATPTVPATPTSPNKPTNPSVPTSPNSPSSPAVKPSVPKTTAEDKEDNDIEEAKTDPRTSDKFEENDEKIERNFNDSKIWYNDDIMNILLMGIDYGSKKYPYGRSDSMIVLSINKKTKKVKMISLSRAVYVAIQGYDNTRLNHAHGLGGAPLAIDTIERNYKIKIDNYVSTGFDTFKQIIDSVGGVDIKLSAKEAQALKPKITAQGLKYKGAGTYNLKGDLALNYVRLRKIDTDRARTQRQRNVLMAIGNKAKNLSVSQLNSALNTILPLITTNLSKTQILSLTMNAKKYLNNSVEQYVIPYYATPLTLVDGFEVLLIDWDKEVKYLHNIVYGDVIPKYYEKT